MHTKESLVRDLAALGIDPEGALMVHTSYKSIGPVEGGPETVIDALMEYMSAGTLFIPAHTWANIQVGGETVMDVLNTPSCVGALPELFRKREGVVRTWHPTHSVGVWGNNAAELAAGDEKCPTPCHRASVYGRLLDLKAKILLIGVNYTCNTFIHGIEEWNDVPGRLGEEPHDLYVLTPAGEKLHTPQNRHCYDPGSATYWKVEQVMRREGVLTEGELGDARALVSDAHALNRILSQMLAKDIHVVDKNEPLDAHWENVTFR